MNELFYNLGVFFKDFIETISDVVKWLFTPLNLGIGYLAPIYLLAGAGLIAALILHIVK